MSYVSGGVWKWRNDSIFNNKNVELEAKVYFIRDYFRQVYAYLSNQNIMQGGYVTKWIGWCPLQQNWVTLNTEGCYQKESNQAGGDGILRNHNGKWLGGFSIRLGICFAVEAKLWALIHGLRLALNKSIPYLELSVSLHVDHKT